MMFDETVIILTRILVASAIGAAIGFERSFHGRPAGFRTHTLVCVASALLMLVTVFQTGWVTNVPAGAIRTDPTRMAQGIMTGIGFLGAGVIFKESPTVRGLTTAASIWVTAAIGILVGIGFYVPAIAGAVVTLIVLSGFRALEKYLPREFYVDHKIKFKRENVITEASVHELIGAHGFKIANLSQHLMNDGQTFEYRMIIKGKNLRNTEKLSRHLRGVREILEFRIVPVNE
ncbi:MgtC/SapB family protein [Afipia birgiae]|jgi:putative Mg2+ transporter-C (MgtC) family protein|uniref:MgtC/SapB family protein n=1 Tax=Afipia birgiae TaxID=151414 RepID=UPI00036B01C9|nr:MgtC/SapB family protein [Afipia birgiae]